MQHLSEQQLIQHRLRVLKEAERISVSATSRLYGITRSTIYEWRKSVAPKKRGPKKVPWQTSERIGKVVIKLREATNFGPKRLRHEMKLIGLEIGEKAIRGVLNRANLTKHHRKKRIRKQQKFYAPYPGYRIQIDTKAVPDEGLDLRSATRHQFTSIDIATKLRFTWIYDELSNSNSIDFLKKVISFFREIGIEVECIQTDNHATFTNLFTGGRKKSEHEVRRIHPLTKFCLENGIAHKLSRPGTPRHNCFVERSHRTDEEEFYRLLNLSSLDNQKLLLEIQKWQHRYNFLRLHSSCGNMPPFKYYLTVLQTGA